MTALVAVVFSTTFLASWARADDLGPVPPPCAGDPRDNPDCTFQSRAVGIQISPHEAQIGQIVTATATRGKDFDNLDPSWSFPFLTGAQAQCDITHETKTEMTCTYKVLRSTGTPGHRYQLAVLTGHSNANMNGGGFESRDYYAFTPGGAPPVKEHKHTIAISANPGSLPADGSSASKTTVTDTEDGVGVAGQNLQLSPPLTGTPKALVCSPEGRLWPQLFSAPDRAHPDLSRFGRVTDSDGSVAFSVHPGTEAGEWFLQAQEFQAGGVTGGGFFSFTPTGGPLPTDLAARFALAAQDKLFSQGLLHTNILGKDAAANQSLLLSMIAETRSDPEKQTKNRFGFPGVLYGPIHTGTGRAAVVFYNPALQSAVLDVETAAKIENLARNQQPLPPDLTNLPTLEAYGRAFGGIELGNLQHQPDEELTYFGYPYPPVSANGLADDTFASQCLKPDQRDFRVEVHSPVSLLFRDASGQRFGVDKQGNRLADAIGNMDQRPDMTRFILPVGSYSVSLHGTGRGSATIAFFSPGARTQSVRVFSFRVRKGQNGSLSVSGGTPASKLSFSGKTVRAASGIRLRVEGVPGRLKPSKKRRTITLNVRDQFGHSVSDAEVRVIDKKVTTTALTAGGSATLSVPAIARHRITLRISAPGIKTFTRKIAVRRK